MKRKVTNGVRNVCRMTKECIPKFLMKAPPKKSAKFDDEEDPGAYEMGNSGR